MSTIRSCATAIGAVLLAASMPLAAHDGSHPPGAVPLDPAPPRWDFTLPALDGSRFVQLSKLPGPVLVNFWGRDCPHCVAELPRLQAFAQAHPQWTVLLVSTDATRDAGDFLQQRGIALPALRSGTNVVGLMKSAGSRSGGLPFTVAVKGGTICDRQAGEVSGTDLDRLRASCEQPAR